jgi:pimeloyl-ACP methyl ester carboxylesterase
MMCDARVFAPQVGALSFERRVRVCDIDAADNVADLAALVLAGAPPSFALAGLSMGGIVAMDIVRQAPNRVVGLALMDTNPLAEVEALRVLRGLQMERVRAGHLFEVLRDEMKPNYLVPGPNREQVLDLCMDMAMELGPDVFCNQSVALRDRPDQSEILRNYQGPSLILCGRQDGLCPVSRHELMHDLMPNSTLCVIEGAGHLPTLEQPETTNAALGRWLKEIGDE